MAKSNLQQVMESATVGGTFKPKITRHHMATEYRELGKAGYDELCRHCKPHLRARLIQPPRRKHGRSKADQATS